MVKNRTSNILKKWNETGFTYIKIKNKRNKSLAMFLVKKILCEVALNLWMRLRSLDHC